MSEHTGQHTTAEHEAHPESVDAPKRHKLSPETWTQLNDMLIPQQHQSRGMRIGNEILEFSSKQLDQAKGVANLLNGLAAANPSGIGIGNREFGDDPDTSTSVVYFHGKGRPEEIVQRGNLLINEANLTLEAVKSPLRIPES